MKWLVKYSFLFFFSSMWLMGKSEGWKQMSPFGANAYIYVQKPWWGSSDPACHDHDKIHVHIQNPGEKIYYGFNWYLPQPPLTSPVTYVRILLPDGQPVKLDTIWYNTPGWIMNYAQAAAGPDAVDPAGYPAFSYTPQQPGDYMIDFGYREPLISGHQTNFDITVVDTTFTPWRRVDGRVYSQSWSIQIGQFNGTMFSYPPDSIVTSVNFNGLGTMSDVFIVMNHNGIDPPPANWITSRMSQPYVFWGGVVDFKIFVNDPDEAIYPTGILGELVSGSLDLTANCNGTAGIDFMVNKAGHVEIQIQIDPDPGFQPVDVMISDSVVPGSNSFTWNGVNGLGQPVQNGTPFHVVVKYLNGLTNLPLNHVVGNSFGFIVNLQRPAGPSPLIYWDDRLIAPANYNFTGCISSPPTSGCHVWTAPPYTWENTINTWWYASSGNASSQSVLFKRSFSSTTDTTVCAGDTVIWRGQSFFTTGMHTINYPSLLTGCDSSYLLNIIHLPAPVVLLGNDTTICTGQTITFDCGFCSGCTYQWSNLTTGQPNIGTSQTYTATQAGIYMATVTGSNGCQGRDTATVSIGQPLTIGVSIAASVNPVCAGTPVTFMATPVNPGSSPAYQWRINAVNAINATNAVFTYVPSNGDVVTCELTSSLSSCISANPVTSNAIVMTVDPMLPVSVSVSSPANIVCAGTAVTFTATHSNGGSSPAYQWKVNGVNAINANNAVYTYIPMNGDVVTCEVTSSEPCPTGNPATSSPVTMIVNTGLPAGVSIAASANPFCEGATVTYSATPVNGGSAPAYQWRVNAVNAINANNAVFSFSPLPGDEVSCVVTSNLNCVTANPANSNIITMVAVIKPSVTFTPCNDLITTLNAKPFKLKGGTPIGGVYSGPGVTSATGMFNPASAGTGIKTIQYSYTNVVTCSDFKTITITVQPAPAFICGNNLTDIRDGRQYTTFSLPNGKCWTSANLDFGITIDELVPQTDNCVPEKYTDHSSFVTRHFTNGTNSCNTKLPKPPRASVLPAGMFQLQPNGMNCCRFTMARVRQPAR